MKIAAIIPAYNEAARIAKVVKVVKGHSLVTETIVVDDASEDQTGIIARQHGAQVIRAETNLGKGGAMGLGLEETEAEIVLFLDADLIGLKKVHLDQLLEPIIAGEVQMTIGIFKAGRWITDLAQVLAPTLSGQRGVKRELLTAVPNLDLARFGVEIALTRYLKENKVNFSTVSLENLTHVMKEEKRGLYSGFKARLDMYWDILKSILYLRRNN